MVVELIGHRSNEKSNNNNNSSNSKAFGLQPQTKRYTYIPIYFYDRLWQCWVQRSLSTTVICGSNPAIGNLYFTTWYLVIIVLKGQIEMRIQVKKFFT